MVKHNLTKASVEYNITRADNGYLFAVDGEDKEGNWVTFRAICASIEELAMLIAQIDALPRR